MIVSNIAALIATASLPVLVLDAERAAYTAQLNEQALLASFQFAGAPCPSAKTEHVSRQGVKLINEPTTAAAREKVRVSGCGRTSVQNVNVIRVRGSSPWRMKFALPGDSIAETALQQGAWSQVVPAVTSAGPPNCKSLVLRDIYVAARPGRIRFLNIKGGAQSRDARVTLLVPGSLARESPNLKASGAWAEVWPIEACGKDRTMMVVFIPVRDRYESRFWIIPVWQQMKNGAGAAPRSDP